VAQYGDHAGIEAQLRAARLRIEALARELDALRSMSIEARDEQSARQIGQRIVYADAELTQKRIKAELLRSRLGSDGRPGFRPGNGHGDDTE